MNFKSWICCKACQRNPTLDDCFFGRTVTLTELTRLDQPYKAVMSNIESQEEPEIDMEDMPFVSGTPEDDIKKSNPDKFTIEKSWKSEKPWEFIYVYILGKKFKQYSSVRKLACCFVTCLCCLVLFLFLLLACYVAYEFSIWLGLFETVPDVLDLPPEAYYSIRHPKTLRDKYYRRTLNSRKRPKWERDYIWWIRKNRGSPEWMGNLFGWGECEYDNQENKGKDAVPKIIHQVGIGELSYPWDEMSKNWTMINPDWELKYWTDETILSFMQENYPWFMFHLKTMPYGVMIADSFRYFVLYHYGGIYIDTDVSCQKALDSYVPYLTKPVVFGGIAHSGGVFSQWLMISPKEHPIFEELIVNLGNAFELHHGKPREKSIMGSSGPHYVQVTVPRFTGSNGYCHIPQRLVDPCKVTMFGASRRKRCRRPCVCTECYTIHHHGSRWLLFNSTKENLEPFSECPKQKYTFEPE